MVKRIVPYRYWFPKLQPQERSSDKFCRFCDILVLWWMWKQSVQLYNKLLVSKKFLKKCKWYAYIAEKHWIEKWTPSRGSIGRKLISEFVLSCCCYDLDNALTVSTSRSAKKAIIVLRKRVMHHKISLTFHKGCSCHLYQTWFCFFSKNQTFFLFPHANSYHECPDHE